MKILRFIGVTLWMTIFGLIFVNIMWLEAFIISSIKRFPEPAKLDVNIKWEGDE